MQKILSWYDVRRVIADKTQLGSHLPKGITRISVYSDALEVACSGTSDDKAVAFDVLKDWFGDRLNGESIKLDIGDELPIEVEFVNESSPDLLIRPFWEERVYAKTGQPRDIDTKQPEIIAFYSYSGGVGKTIHLAAYLLALLERADESENPISILVIDADLSSPRISYWSDPVRNVSLINFLECYQSISREKVLSYFAQQLRNSKKKWGGNSIYNLPAFSTEQQLLDKNVLPAHLVRNDADGWGYTESIQALAMSVDADYVFMNLESGLSEVSAPILFDNSVHRFLITSSEISSLRGTEMILRQLGQSNPRSIGIVPTVIFNKMKAELCIHLSVDIEDRLRQAYCDTDLTRLTVETTDYHKLQCPGDSYSHFAVVGSWREAMVRLKDTSIEEIAQKWVSNM